MEPYSHVVSLAAEPVAREDTADFSQRITYTYLIGTYLAVNAIRDAYLLVDGPDCVHMKSQFIQGNHDWLATLISVSGHHRIANTALHPVQMAKGREDTLRKTLKRMASHPYAGGVLLTSMPMAAVTAVDYERLCREVGRETGRPVITVPGRSLNGDWMDGYAEVLLALARRLDLSSPSPDPRKVAVVGYLYDRNEGDHRGNVREIRRILAALGLEVVSVWLEGQSFAELDRVQQAGLILSFPYGRKAAAWVARRTGARLIECDYPFGLPAVERFVRQVARETGREEAAEALIRRELGEVVPPLEFVIPYCFQNRRVAYVGDPVLAAGVAEVVDLLGAEMSCIVITNMERHAKGLGERVPGRPEILVYPKLRAMMRLFQARQTEPRLALLIANNAGVGMLPRPGLATVEFGFPSFYTHWLGERPFLGFRGFLAFVDLLANAMRAAEAQEWARRLWNR